MGSPLEVIHIGKAQQWETPWEVFEYVRSHWRRIAFDACASPLNALTEYYEALCCKFGHCTGMKVNELML